jgi:hypothetical protein
MARIASDLDQALSFLSSFVTVTVQRELASQASYFVPLSSSLDFEEEQGRWMNCQQLQRLASDLGWIPSL